MSQRKRDLGIPLPYTWLNPSTRPNNVIRWGDYSSAVVNPAAADSFIVSNEIVPSAQTSSNNAPWATVTATVTLSPGTSPTVVAGSSLATNQTSLNTANTPITQPVPLTVDASTQNHRTDAPASTIAGLDAMNMPVFAPVLGMSFADVENSAGIGGSREFGQDPHSSTRLSLLVNYMATTFAGSGDAYSGTSMVDPTTVTTAHNLFLTNPHA